MKRIETRENEFIVQLRDSLRSSFPPALNLKVDYYLGEEKGVKGLYFTLTSVFGLLYRKVKQMRPDQMVSDVEDDFMNNVIDEMIMNGISFFNLLAFDSVSPSKVKKEILAVPFKNSTPRKLVYEN